jgi:hypothetical protein
MARKRRLHKRYGRKRRSEDSGGYKRNPPLWTDLAEFIGPGFAGFAATRLLTRIAAVQLAKKKPSWGKHAGAITSVAAFLGAWWASGKWKVTAKYQMPIVVGAGLAAIQSIIQLYIPKLGWMITDASTEIDSLKINGDTTQQQALPSDLQYVDDDPNEYTYNDSYDAGRYSKEPNAPQSAKAQQVSQEEDLLSDLGLTEEDLGNVNLGSLGAN